MFDTTLDTVRAYAEAWRVDSQIKPSLLVRTATDSNYLLHQVLPLPGFGNAPKNALALMNCVSPGMRIPGVFSWNVTESLDTLTQTATMQCINALPVSKLNTTLQGSGNVLPARWFNPSMAFQVVTNGLGIPTIVNGNVPVWTVTDTTTGRAYLDNNVLYRVYLPETISVANISSFPNPRVPADIMQEELQPGQLIPDPHRGTYWQGDTGGGGAYFLLIDEEVVRVTDWDPNAGTFTIPPGGRGVNGVLQDHLAGATVRLIGFPPYTGLSNAPNYLSIDDFEPWTSMLRTGTCLESYEGYGDFAGPLSKVYNPQSNYMFTGYWFTKRTTATIDDSGKPVIQFQMDGSAHIFTEQKISQELLFSSKTLYGSWAGAAFDAAGANRKMPGDWYDYKMWDPTLPNAYPFTLCIELAQHKNFFNHMQESQNGTQCEFCVREFGDAVRAGNAPGSIGAARAVGKHIYMESIRVYNNCDKWGAGPVRTYLRLMSALAIGAWENNIDASPLAQRFSKIPTQLWKNLTEFQNGLVWNGRLSFKPVTTSGAAAFPNKVFDYTNQGYEDQFIIGNKVPLTCPFQAQYDKQEFSAPMQDLADANGMQFLIDRWGHPIFIPLGLKLRGYWGQFANYAGEWHMAQGYSISGYNHDLDIANILTNVTVSGTTAFSVDLSVSAGGTMFDPNTQRYVMCSGKAGNKWGMQLTGGAIQTDTVSLDNLVLGFDWATQPANYGLKVNRTNNDGSASLVQFYRLPALPTAAKHVLQYNDNYTKQHKTKVKNIQNFIAFLLVRRYINAIKNINPDPSQPDFGIKPTGTYDSATVTYVALIQNWLKGQMGQLVNSAGEDTKVPLKVSGVWDRNTYFWAKRWATKFSDFIKLDVWWWAINGLDWDQYVAHILGIAIPEYQTPSSQSGGPQWTIDQLALKTAQENAAKAYEEQMVNIGNVTVNQSLRKSIVRSVSTNFADPRVMLGDIIWLNIPGHLSPSNPFGSQRPPFKNGMYVSEIDRSMTLGDSPIYTCTYTGYAYMGTFDDSVMSSSTTYYTDDQGNTFRK